MSSNDQITSNANNPSNRVAETTVLPINKLLRFLYLGTTRCFFNKFEKPNVRMIEHQLECVMRLAESRINLPITIINKAYRCKCLLRTDETMWALAFCARQDTLPELRQKAHDEAITLIDNQKDFIFFIRCCVELKRSMTGDNNRRGIGKGLRRVINKWYNNHTEIQLANIFGEHRKLFGWSHRDILQLSHIKTIPSQNVQQNPSNVEENRPLSDREIIIKSQFMSSNRFVAHVESIEQPGEGTRRLRILMELKANECIETAVDAIKSNNIPLEQIPSHLLECTEVWEAIIPTLSVHVAIDKLNTLKDYGFLNGDHRFAKKYIKLITDLDKCDAECLKICPIKLYILKKMYEKNERYHCPTKRTFYEKKKENKKIVVNKTISKKLDLLFDHLLTKQQKTATKYFITLDLRCKNENFRVLRNEHINCSEAMTLLAYMFLMKEKHVSIYQYTADKNVIQSVSIPKKGYAEAEKILKSKAIPRTWQSLSTPLAEATRMKRKIDVFLVVTDSLARFCRQGVPPIAEFNEYKKNYSPNAKYIIVNLKRANGDLRVPSNNDPKGLFEIAGFDENTPKVIKALAENAFS